MEIGTHTQDMPTADKRSWNTAIAVISAPMLLLLGGCVKDEEPVPAPPPTNEEELITTLKLNFISSGGGEQKLFSYTDLDGAGGGAPVIEADTLSSDSTYNVMIEVLNESESPSEDITAEIIAESEDHQFFFFVNGASLAISYSDVDGNGNPIGVASEWSAGAAASGTVTVILRHMPDKFAAGASGGDITNAGGETDIEVQFPLVID